MTLVTSKISRRAHMCTCATAELKVDIVVEGKEVWDRWRELIGDLFFWFEYLYEDGSGTHILVDLRGGFALCIILPLASIPVVRWMTADRGSNRCT